MKSHPKDARGETGFTLADVMVTVAIGATLVGISVPMAKSALDSMRLSSGVREVEREVQSARLQAVSKNRAMQVRFNCPTTGQYRILEVTGVAAVDNATNRCDPTLYPYPGVRDSDPATPQYDGPIRFMGSSLSVSSATLLFAPNGTTATVANGVRTTVSTPAKITVTRAGVTAEVTVNGLGKIQLAQ